MVDYQVMSNSHHQGKIYLLRYIFLFQGFDYLDKSILEDVLCNISVQNFAINKAGDSLIVPVDKNFKSFSSPSI